MRISSWLFAWSVMAMSCRLIVPLEGLSGTEPPPSDGGSSGAAGSSFDANVEPDRNASDGKNVIDAPDAPLPPPMVVIRGADPITGITVNLTDLYWVEGGNVYRTPKQGNGQPLGIDSSRTAFDVAVDDTFVYWSDDGLHNVWRKPLTDLSAIPVIYWSPGAPYTEYLAVGQGGQVFVTDGAMTMTINSSPNTNPNFPAGNIYSGQTDVAGIALFNGDLYWGYGGAIVGGATGDATMSGGHGIRKGSSNGLTSPSEVLFRDLPGVVSSITTDGVNIYWLEDGRRIRRTPLKDARGSISEVCAEPAADADAGPSSGSDVAVDDQWVYFSEPSLMRISKCPKP